MEANIFMTNNAFEEIDEETVKKILDLFHIVKIRKKLVSEREKEIELVKITYIFIKDSDKKLYFDWFLRYFMDFECDMC